MGVGGPCGREEERPGMTSLLYQVLRGRVLSTPPHDQQITEPSANSTVTPC